MKTPRRGIVARTPTRAPRIELPEPTPVVLPAFLAGGINRISPVARRASVGCVIGTYGTVGTVHLQIEARNRYNPGLPLLVVDDCSPCAGQLLDLCRNSTGVSFVCNPRRLGHLNGDLAVFAHGLQWAYQKGFDLLVKFSRSWLVCKPWVDDFKQLAYKTQHATYSGRCNNYSFGFRTECTGLLVEPWLAFLPDITAEIERGCPFVETYLHQVAQRIKVPDSATQHVAPDLGYVNWGLMYETSNRHRQSANMFWHDTSPPEVYWGLARQWGLTQYTRGDFK